ncbi:MAG: GTPase [Billgrantia sp.]
MNQTTATTGVQRGGLSKALSSSLPSLLKMQRKLRTRELSDYCVDGIIIGTGKADFTQNNVVYRLNYNNKEFQLIDVPGIEGNESRYEAMVQEAIAKAHLVFYINGTNKKPETETGRKIKQYLNRDAVVHVICNVRGKADSYEFDEDRVSLEQTHRDAIVTLEQTQNVLGNILEPELLQGLHLVQGLIGFCSMAFTDNMSTTINPERRDLIKAQLAYLKDFKNKEEMRRFSRIREIEEIIHDQCSNFDRNIILSNKRKVTRLLEETLEILKQQLIAHEKVAKNIRKETSGCAKEIDSAFSNFATSFSRKRGNLINGFFEELHEVAHNSIETHFSDKNLIEKSIEEHAEKLQKKVKFNFMQMQKSELATLSENIDRSVKRLQENVKRVKFEHELNTASMDSTKWKGDMDSVNFSINELGGIFLGIGGYALSGLAIGSVFPGVGNAIGVAVGVAVGVVSNLLKYFFSGRGKKIREAQKKVAQTIEKQRELLKDETIDAERKFLENIRIDIKKKIVNELYHENKKMEDVEIVLKEKIITLSELKYRMEENPDGAV